ncbi:MAG: alpha-E domain-containing protein [Pirellulaceae bacterium]|jgi:uncharacterized alpha-E superfamily protein
MLSRVADSIYWMCRYIERAENLARFIEVTFSTLLGTAANEKQSWSPLISTTGDLQWFQSRYGEATREQVVYFLTFDPEYPNSILSCVTAARENGRSIREALPTQVWEQLNQFYQRTMQLSRQPETLWQSPLDFYHEIKLSSHLFKGLMDGSMSHGEGWHFARMGRYLEQADKTTRMVDVQYYRLQPIRDAMGSPVDDLQWSALLHSLSGLEMYRQKYHQILPVRVVDFLMLDRAFPSSVMHCIDQANISLHAISGCPVDSFCNLAEQRLGRLRSQLAFMRVDEILQQGLHAFIAELQNRINAVDDALFQDFIAISGAPAADETPQMEAKMRAATS